ncbi:MAG: 50S ribosomal protein L18 [Alphaproteobacteria bacterium]|nr:50S ribosomal protein L18 [Alphaproteobacteria bacterium]NCQ88838.1 50S ribosomal protein L18 [Alphaproteobacteria bacterium]NCT07239.1 50S ribosomal protein L18 [Alphaproteobacteria bacterium]
MTKRLKPAERRKFGVRRKLRKVNINHNPNREVRPRLSVHRTNKAIYAQVIDDIKGVTIVSASTLDKDLALKNGGNVEAAEKVGKLIAERAKKAGVSKVQFDRGEFIYHGRVKAVAEGARAGGLEF